MDADGAPLIAYHPGQECRGDLRLARPAPRLELKLVKQGTQLALSWNAYRGASGYELYRLSSKQALESLESQPVHISVPVPTPSFPILPCPRPSKT